MGFRSLYPGQSSPLTDTHPLRYCMNQIWDKIIPGILQFSWTMTIFAIGWQSTCPWSCQSRPETPTALDTVYILEQLALRTCCLFAELVQNGFCAVCKCFTYVTKTIANLTTMAPLFLRLTSPLDLKFTFFSAVKTKITHLFCWTHSTLNSASKCDRVNQNKRNNKKTCKKSSLTKI